MKQLVSPGSSFGPTWGDNFSDSSGNKLFALYQGTTLVVPPPAKMVRALAPLFAPFTARLKVVP
jgi:hypothetical protein